MVTNRIALIMFFLLFSSISEASTGTSGDWHWDTSAGVQSASVAAKGTGELFGVWCYEEQGACHFQMAPDFECEEGITVPVLINSDAGANYMSVTCMTTTKPNGSTFYFVRFDDFNQILSFVIKGSWFGMAFPLQSGLFKVSRFSLNGSNAALRKITEKQDSGSENQKYL